MQVKDKVVVVTGAAEGIGAAMSQRFAQEGARKVVVADINAEGARKMAREIDGLGVGCNVGVEADILNLIHTTEAECGPIDLFCSNAGIAIIGGVEVPNVDWQRIWDVNVMSHVFVARALIPGMIERGGGRLVITASAAGLLSQIGSAPYSVTKHAAVGLAENIAITYGQQGIKVSVICPQAVDTKMAYDGGGPAAVDGLMTPDKVADDLIQGLAEDRFMILPHEEVKTYIQRKASDYDRWIGGMQRLQGRFLEARADKQPFGKQS